MKYMMLLVLLLVAAGCYEVDLPDDMRDTAGDLDSDADIDGDADADTDTDTDADGDADTDADGDADADTDADSDVDTDVSYCVYNGNIYYPGDSFPAVDGCNICGCEPDADGSVTAVCTLMACDDPCAALTGTECGTTPGCVAMTGRLIDETNLCYGEPVFTHCMTDQTGCGDMIAIVTNPVDYTCWWFPSTCVPTVWTMSLMADAAGVAMPEPYCTYLYNVVLEPCP